MLAELLPLPGASAPAHVAPSPDSLLDAALAGRSERTRRAYRSDYDDFGRFVGKAPTAALSGLVQLDHGAANAVGHAYLAHLRARELSPATIARRLAALRAASKLARSFGLCDWSLDVESPRVESLRDTSGPGADGWASMLASARAHLKSPGGRRDLAMLLLLRDHGLRRFEVVGLDRSHWEAPRSRVWVLGKGKAERVPISVNKRTREALSAWRRDLPDEDGPLFVRLDRGGRPTADRITGDGVALVVGRLGDRASLGRRVRPHGLRHEAITAVLEATGGDVRKAQKFARHANPQTTLRYDDNRVDEAGAMARLLGGE